jgi:hypothetical protein
MPVFFFFSRFLGCAWSHRFHTNFFPLIGESHFLTWIVSACLCR